MIRKLVICLVIFALLWTARSIIEQTYFPISSEELAMKQVNGDKEDYARMRATLELQRSVDYGIIIAGVACSAAIVFRSLKTPLHGPVPPNQSSEGS